MPGVSGVLVVTNAWATLPLPTRLRVHWAPGIPTPFIDEGETKTQNPGKIAPRECGVISINVVASEAKQSSFLTFFAKKAGLLRRCAPRNDGRRSCKTLRCRPPRKRGTQYSRDANVQSEKPPSTGSPGQAGRRQWGWRRTVHYINKPAFAGTTLRDGARPLHRRPIHLPTASSTIPATPAIIPCL